MPQKIRELVAALRKAGFSERSGKGSHRRFYHPKYNGALTISGKLGDDARSYQEGEVRKAIEESSR